VALTKRVPAGLAVKDDEGIHLFDANYEFSKVRWGCGSGSVGVRITSVLWIWNYFFRIRIRLFRKFRIRIRPNFSGGKSKKFKKNEAQVLILKKICVKPTFGFLFSLLFSIIIVTTGYLLSRFHAILANENWSLSEPDPKWIIPDPDPANNFGSGSTTLH